MKKYEHEVLSVKEWLTANGGSYGNGTISVIGMDDVLQTGRLDWQRSKEFVFGNFNYIEVPYKFEKNANSAWDATQPEEGVEFAIVFRKKTNFKHSKYETAIRVTSSGRFLNRNSNSLENVTISIYHSLTGTTLNSWLKSSSSSGFKPVKFGRKRNFEASLRDSQEEKATLLPTANSFQQCVTYSTVTYYVTCKGPDMDNVICTYRLVSYDATICYEVSWLDDIDVPGGGWWPPPPNFPSQPDPCATSQAQSTTTFAAETIFQNAKSMIQNAASDGFEHGISFGKDDNGAITKSNMSTGNQTSGVAPSIPNKIADIHNHTENGPPSPGDVYSFIDGLTNQPNFTNRYVITAGGDMYALVLTNKQAAMDFNKRYPRVQFKDANGNLLPPDFPQEIFDKIDDVKRYLFLNGNYSNLQMDESSLAFVLQQYNTGLSLFKMNPEGSFKKMKTNEEVTGGNSTYIIDNCF